MIIQEQRLILFRNEMCCLLSNSQSGLEGALDSVDRTSALQSLAISPEISGNAGPQMELCATAVAEGSPQLSKLCSPGPGPSESAADDTLSLLTELHRDAYSREAKPPGPSSQGFGLLQALRRDSGSQQEWFTRSPTSDPKGVEMQPGSASTQPPLSSTPPPAQELQSPSAHTAVADSRKLLVSLSEQQQEQQEQQQELLRQHDKLQASLQLRDEQMQSFQDQQRSMLRELQTGQEQMSTKQHSELRDVREDLRLLLSSQQEVHQGLSRLQQHVLQVRPWEPERPHRAPTKVSVEAPRTEAQPADSESKPSEGWAAEVQESRRPLSGATSSNHRRWLIQQVFRMLDHDRDERLAQTELKGLANLMGFEGADSDWMQEYRHLCANSRVQESQGFDLDSFAALLEDPKGCPATTDALFRALLDLRSTGDEDRERASLVVSLFESLDRDHDGAVGVKELRPLAAATGFNGSDDEWDAEYRLLCEDLPNTRELLRSGLDLTTFGRLLADSSGSGLFCSVPQLRSFLADFARDLPDQEPTAEHSALSTPLAERQPAPLPKPALIDQLPALKRHSVGARPSEAANQLSSLSQEPGAARRATVHGELGAATAAAKPASAPEPAPNDGRRTPDTQANVKSRSRLIRTVFQLMDANADGVLDSAEMSALASVSRSCTCSFKKRLQIFRLMALPFTADFRNLP